MLNAAATATPCQDARGFAASLGTAPPLDQIRHQVTLAMVPHPWLKRLLPDRAALLRAPLVEQIVLEDWLLSQKL